eukprot:9227107-Alexandrium_andersonii.AAC.1
MDPSQGDAIGGSERAELDELLLRGVLCHGRQGMGAVAYECEVGPLLCVFLAVPVCPRGRRTALPWTPHVL